MKPNKIITLLSIAILPIIATAQDQPQIKIGSNGVPHGINETGVAETISIKDLNADPIIHITRDNKQYTIENFDIAVLPKGGDVIGIFHMKRGSKTGNISNLKTAIGTDDYFRNSTRIFIENLTAICIKCTDMRAITVKAFSIKLED